MNVRSFKRKIDANQKNAGWNNQLRKPMHPHNFKDLMVTTLQKLNPDFCCGEKILKGFLMMGTAYNNCIANNRKNDPMQTILPTATGAGKTVSAKLYLSFAKDLNFSGLMAVSEVSTAINTVKEINEWAGKPIAKAHYSPSSVNRKTDEWCSIDDAPRVLIITHSLFKSRSETGKDIDKLNTYEGKRRDLIIIDEGIDLIKCVSFGTNEINGLRGTLTRDGSLDAFCDKLKDFNSILFKVSESGRYAQTATAKKFMSAFREMCVALAGDLQDGKLNLANYTRGSKKKRDFAATTERSNAIQLLRRIARVISEDYDHSVEGGNIVCHVQEDLNNEFGSTVILNATSNINPSSGYQIKQGKKVMCLPEVMSRDYQNVTLNISNRADASQSKYKIHDIPLEQGKLIDVAKAYCKAAKSIIMPGDKLLVVSYKIMMPILNEHNPDPDNIRFTYWGSSNVKGSNEFRNFNKIMIAGWFRRKQHYYDGLVLALAPELKDYIPTNGSLWGDVLHLKEMMIVEDIIQAVNRIRCRTSIDAEGNCEPSDIYMFTGGDEYMGKLISTTLSRKMPNLQLSEWSPRINFKLKIKRSKIEDRSERAIDFILMASSTQEEITVPEVTKGCGFNKGKMERLLKSDIFQAMLDDAGVVYLGGKKRGKSGAFIVR